MQPFAQMKFLFLVALTATLAFADRAEEAQISEWNANARYTIESIDFLGHKTYRLSSSIVEDMQRLIGQNLNVSALNRLAKRINDDLRARSVTFRVARGGEPAHVRVLFDVDKQDVTFDVGVHGFAYTSREGWTGEGQARATFGANAVTFAALTNGDDLVERYSGIRARYDRLAIGTDRVRLGLEFDAFRETFNPSTTAIPSAPTYRSRLNLEPSATFVIAKPLTLTFGLAFETLNPSSPSAHMESANALTNTVRFHRRWTEFSAPIEQDIDAGYSLRAGTKALGSDYAYTRHAVHVRYGFHHESQSVQVALQAGVIYGRAPLFERFMLGNSSTLRGWNKYDLAPLGGNRAVHASVTYGYHIMRVFYDTGSIWDHGNKPEQKHSAGIGLTTGLGLFGKNALLLAVAFPMRQGRIEPVFIAGMNF